MEEQDSDKTAFVCREEQFKYKTMPFELCNAGATFQRLMDIVMSGLAFEVCLVTWTTSLCLVQPWTIISSD